MKNWMIFTLLIGLAITMLTGCGDSDKNTVSDSSIIENENKTPNDLESSEQVENVGNIIISFLDARKESYEVVIDPSAPMHAYDWDRLSNSNRFYTYKDGKYSSRIGIDVSKYQGDIDWNAVKADGIEFVFIRAAYRGYGAEGNLKEDQRFKEYFKGAREAGLDVGIYVFSQAINEDEAIEEAEFAISLLDGEKLQLPVVFDPETIRDDDARTDNVSGEQFTRNTIAFCERVKELGYEPMVYTNMLWEAFNFDMKALENYPFWYADYEAKPQTPYDFSIWQYTEKGKVAGIDGYVDLDIEFIK